MPVSLARSIGWLTREPQLTLHFNGCASSTATLPEMQNPSPANDRQCRSLEFLNDFFVPSLSSRYFHSSSRTSTGPRYIYIFIYIHTHIYICTYTDIRVGSPRIARMHAAACTATSLPRVHPTVHTWKPSIRTCGRNCGTAAHPVGCVGCVRDYVRTSLIFTTPNTIRNVCPMERSVWFLFLLLFRLRSR